MVMLLLVFVMVASSLAAVCPTHTSQADDIASQHHSFQEILTQKDVHLLEQDKTISDLQKKVQELKEKGNEENQELLDDVKAKVEEQEAKAAELERTLEKKSKEILDFKHVVQSLQLAEEEVDSEVKQLELFAASQKKQLDELQKALHLFEDLMLEAQAQLVQKEQEIMKVCSQWLPLWADKHLVYLQNFQNSWSFALKKKWEKAVSVVGGYMRNYRSKGLKYAEVLRTHTLPYLKKKTQVVWETSKDYGDGPLTTLEPYVNKTLVFLRPHLLKMSQYYKKALAYGIEHHLQLQRKVRKLLKNSKVLASVASKEVVWFLASAVLILPLYGALLILSSFFGKNVKGATSLKRTRQSRRTQM